jgi:tetratricopeptide (TPR) repeat protein
MRQEFPEEQFWALGFSGDGKRWAASGVDHTVAIWDCSSGAVVARSRQGPEAAMDLAFSPDGRRLAIATRRQIKLVDAETAEEVLVLRGRAQLTPSNNGFNARVRFSPDGKSLAAICSDTADPVAVWSIDSEIPARFPDEVRATDRRAVARHLQLALRLMWGAWHTPVARSGARDHVEQSYRVARAHIEQTVRIGLETPLEYLKRAQLFASLGDTSRVEDDLLKATALVPGDNSILAEAGDIYASVGRFASAGRWYARLTAMPGGWANDDWYDVCTRLVLAGDIARYRAFCDSLEGNVDSIAADRLMDLAMSNALAPHPGADHEKLVRIAARLRPGAVAAKRYGMPNWGLLCSAAIQLRAGELSRAEPNFREAIAKAPDTLSRALGAAWLAIALLQEEQKDEAKKWFDQADQFIRDRLPGKRPELEHGTPLTFAHAHWRLLLIVWREAQGRILDMGFPADPFVR